ncbi:MAG: hypothetical protein CK424_06860 [Legionella sp.]|nr:MAG: hypothetical protein CK424_06860 [Legionella sp.]
MKSIWICAMLMVSKTLFATTTYYPGNTGGPTAGDLKSQSPTYYPPIKPAPPITNPQIMPSAPSSSQNTNPQLQQQTLPPSTGQ